MMQATFEHPPSQLSPSYSEQGVQDGQLSTLNEQDIPLGLRCEYSTKRCPHLRANKKGGGLHRFCEIHRQQANLNQRRTDHKRRALRQLSKEGSSPLSLPDPVDFENDEALITGDDVALLQQLLFSHDNV